MSNKQLTIHVRDSDAIKQQMASMEADYKVVRNSNKYDVYTAIFTVAKENEEEVIQELHQIQNSD